MALQTPLMLSGQASASAAPLAAEVEVGVVAGFEAEGFAVGEEEQAEAVVVASHVL